MKALTEGMVDMGETWNDGPSEVISKEEEKKPHYPDIYSLNITKLPVIQDTKVGDDVILVIKAKVKSLEVRDTENNGRKATACLEIREAAAHEMPQMDMKQQNKEADITDLPEKSNKGIMDFIDMGEQQTPEDDYED